MSIREMRFGKSLFEKQKIKSTKIEESSMNYFKRLYALIFCSSESVPNEYKVLCNLRTIVPYIFLF